MSAVSKKLMPASSAASTTARVPSRSTRPPKLLQPRPTRDTRTPPSPSTTSSTPQKLAAGGHRAGETDASRATGLLTELCPAGLRLKAAREAAGISQRRLAFPGCSAAYISRVEAGTRIASAPILRELAERLGVTEAHLCSGGSPTARSALDDAEIALRLDHTDEAAQLFETALMDAGSDTERARAFEGLGQLAQRAGNPQLAVDLFEKALSLVDDDVSERPSLAEGLARSYAALGRMARSISILERCVDASENDPVQYIRFAGLLGAALTDNGSFAEAERVLAHAISRGREVKDPYTRARLYWSESRLHLEQGQTELAARYARRTLEILRATEDGYAIAHALQSLAHIYLDLGRSEEALALLDEGG